MNEIPREIYLTMLSKVPVPQDYDEWFRIMAAVDRCVGHEEAERWSSSGSKFVPGEWLRLRAEGLERYDGQKAGPGTLIHYCRQFGVHPGGEWDGVIPTVETNPFFHFRILHPREMQALPEPAWLVPDVLPDRSLTLLSGPSKSGKSALLTAWATDDEWLGRPLARRRWMHFTEETPEDVRARYTAAGAPLTEDFALRRLFTSVRTWPPQDWTFDGFLNEARDAVIAADLNENVISPDVLVIDTLLFWAELEDANSSTAVSSVMRKVQDFKASLPDKTVIIVHQTRKAWNDDDPASNIAGSVAFRATFGCNLTITRKGGACTLHAEGRALPDTAGIDYWRVKTDGVIQWQARSDTQDVLDILQQGGQWNVKDILEELSEDGLTEETLRKRLNRLRASNTVTAEKRGRTTLWSAGGQTY